MLTRPAHQHTCDALQSTETFPLATCSLCPPKISQLKWWRIINQQLTELSGKSWGVKGPCATEDHQRDSDTSKTVWWKGNRDWHQAQIALQISYLFQLSRTHFFNATRKIQIYKPGRIQADSSFFQVVLIWNWFCKDLKRQFTLKLTENHLLTLLPFWTIIYYYLYYSEYIFSLLNFFNFWEGQSTLFYCNYLSYFSQHFKFSLI